MLFAIWKNITSHPPDFMNEDLTSHQHQIIKCNELEEKVSNQVIINVISQAWLQSCDPIDFQVGNQVGDKLRNQIRSQVRNQVWNQTWLQVAQHVFHKIREELNARQFYE